VVVIDNASMDGTVAAVHERFPWVHLMENDQNLGFATACNQGIRQSQGRYILLLNSDVVLGPSDLNLLLRFADEHPKAGIVGGKLVNRDGTFQASFNDFPTWWGLLLEPWGLQKLMPFGEYYPSYPPERSVEATTSDWVGGACMLARAAAIAQVGVLDERFFMYAEDIDWCHRMWQSGWEVWYTPEVAVVHLGGASGDRQGTMQRLRMYASKVYFAEKHLGMLVAGFLRCNYRISSCVKTLIYLLQSFVLRDASARQLARSHWQTAIRRDWA
jgi:GT2 family glycosyltransferase